MELSEDMWYAIADAAGNPDEYSMLSHLVESIDEIDTPCWATTAEFAVYVAPVGQTTWDFKIFKELAHAHALR